MAKKTIAEVKIEIFDKIVEMEKLNDEIQELNKKVQDINTEIIEIRKEYDL